MNLDNLRLVPLLADVPEDELALLAPLTAELEVAPGDVLMEEGSPADALYVVLEGQFDITKRAGAQQVQLNRTEAGEVLGELALVAQRPRSATVTACSPGRVLEIQGDGLRKLLASPRAAEAILQTVMRRLENQEVQLRQHAKMAALGTLTAGLLHDLNNPAAAIARGVARLPAVLADLGGAPAGLADATPRDAAPADVLERADRADELESWLEEQGVEEPWKVAGPLVERGWQRDELEALLAGRPVAETATWLALRAQVDQLVEELREGSARISGIVSAVKTHSRHDEAPIQHVDIHELLESTLVVMRYKLREGIEVVREYGAEKLVVEGYPSELNQVWTNLVDNAADAMDGRGRITLRTAAEDDAVVVSVTDDGCGIPPAVKDRIFEPFFTTKEVGRGSGIGLSSVFRIVTQRHGGSIDVESEPGRTTFTVRLPRTLVQ